MRIHIVKKGDTLFDLANKYQVKLEEIIALNPQIENPDRIQAGMKVKLPSKSIPIEPPASEFVHKHIVKQGDTLWKLGKAWDVSLQSMVQANPQLKNPNVLMTGEVVYIPKHGAEQLVGSDHPQGYMPISKVPNYPFPQETPVAPQMETAPVPEVPLIEAQTQMNQEIIAESSYMPIPELPQMQETPCVPEVPESQSPCDVSPTLTEPYEQAVHPFAQMNIQATEVFAFPSQPELPKEPCEAESPYMYSPPYMQQGVSPEYAAYPHPMVSDGGCGCGGMGHASAVDPWSQYPPYYPTGPAASMPITPYQTYPPYSSYPAGFQPICPPYGDMQPGYMAAPGSLPPMGYPYSMAYHNPYGQPQAQIHPLTPDEEMEEALRSEKNDEKIAKKSGSKTVGSARKAKSSSSGSSRRQSFTEETVEPRPNLPWINV